MNTMANTMNTVSNTVSNIVATNTPKNTSSSFLSFKNGPSMTVIIFSVLLVFLIIFVSVFWKQIRDGWNVLYEQVRVFFGAAKSPPPPSYDNEKEYVTKDPVPPQDEALHHEKTLVEKALPGRQQVFNIHKNAYTYYDAEPLCKALGAELASYEQVKQAYAQGADWCNYGWVKGQMAVFPTSEDTYKKTQSGPEDGRNSCGDVRR
jgi:hypothetical protein